MSRICFSRRAVGDHRRQIEGERGAKQDALALGERLKAVDAGLDQLWQIDGREIEIELACVDLGNVEEVVEQAQGIEPALMDVLDIALVARIADGAEPFLQHELG